MIRLVTIKQLVNTHSAFTEQSIRWQIFNAEKNGLKPALYKIGKRVYIDEVKFIEWIYSQPFVNERQEKLKQESLNNELY